MFDNGFEEGFHIFAGHIGRFRSPTFLRRGVDKGRIQHVFVGAQFDKQIQHFVFHFFRAGAGAVHFVNADDDVQAKLEGFLQHEFRLRHGPFEGVHQKDHAGDHFQHPFDFAAEIRVARRVDNIDLRVPVLNRGIFRQNRNAPFLLDVAGVHDPLRYHLIVTEHAGLPEEHIDQGGLSMINVGNDGYISNISLFHKLPFSAKAAIKIGSVAQSFNLAIIQHNPFSRKALADVLNQIH